MEAEEGPVKSAEHSTADDKQMHAQMVDNKVAAIMLEAGVIFHSIFVGLDLGVNNEASVVRPLMIALCFHQVRSRSIEPIQSVLALWTMQEETV